MPQPRFRPSPPRALTEEERSIVLGHLHAVRFQDRSPAEVYATLLDEGVYGCSIRTRYRILEAQAEAHERRDQLTHPAYRKPQLLATGPNSKLLTSSVEWKLICLTGNILKLFRSGWMPLTACTSSPKPLHNHPSDISP